MPCGNSKHQHPNHHNSDVCETLVLQIFLCENLCPRTLAYNKFWATNDFEETFGEWVGEWEGVL